MAQSSALSVILMPINREIAQIGTYTDRNTCQAAEKSLKARARAAKSDPGTIERGTVVHDANGLFTPKSRRHSHVACSNSVQWPQFVRYCRCTLKAASAAALYVRACEEELEQSNEGERRKSHQITVRCHMLTPERLRKCYSPIRQVDDDNRKRLFHLTTFVAVRRSLASVAGSYTKRRTVENAIE